MKNRFVLSSIISCSLLNVSAEKKIDKPNVILIMADDLGWGDVGFNGNEIIKTPNLDALAKDGIIMDRFYSAAPVSSPTRASVLTGRHPFRMGVFFANVGLLRPEEVTLPELLKKEGYVSGHFGKWHLGTLTDSIKDANRGGDKHPELLNPPSLHGYDDAFVTESKVPTFDPMRRPAEYDNRFWDYIKAGEPSEEYGTYYWDHSGNIVRDNIAGDDSRVIMDRVISFIDQVENHPFCSVVWFHTPHLPCVAGPEYAAMYEKYNKQERNYYGCITAMDEQIGRLTTYLKNKGTYDNTIIFFCSDNGPENGTPGKTNGLRDKKQSLYEGGIRVPSIAVWPRKLFSGKRIDIPCSTSDYLPTIADMLQIPIQHKIDGESVYPQLKGEDCDRDKNLYFYSSNQAAMIEKEYKLYYKNGEYELYCIPQDFSESNNLAKKRFDILNKMKNELHDHARDTKKSFNGVEYGTNSFDRLNQEWKDVFSVKSQR